MEETENKELPSDTRAFLGMGNGENFSTQPRTGFGRTDGTTIDTDAFDERTAKERRARAQASAQMLFGTDVSKLDDSGASALYQSVTEGLFGLPDTDGSVAFGKRAAKDPRQNIDMLRRFVKGEYSLIEDPEYTKWREMDDEAKFEYARKNETVGNSLKSLAKGERGPSTLELLTYALSTPLDKAGPLARSDIKETQRKMRYEDLTDEEKVQYRADVVADYDEKLSRRQTLATFLSFSQGLSDRASHLLAKSFSDGTPDTNIETLPEDERDRVYSAFSLMRGDQKSGTLLFVPTDFTDDTVLNRAQLGLYGLQQSILGLATDTWGIAKDASMWTYAKTALSESERADFFAWWDAQARAEQAMKQQLPDAQGFVGEAFQGVMENLHWFIPYSMIGKGGKMANAARGVKGEQGILKGLATTLRPMKLGGTLKEEKAALEAGKAAMEAGAAATKAAWTLDVNGVKKLGDMGSAILARQMAAVERYTQMLSKVNKDLEAAKWWKDAAGTGMWMAGEASAFSAFASEYIANADAAGISREESVLTAAAIGLINAKIEQLYVPGLESSLSPAQIKSLTFAAMAQAIRSDGAAGFRKWLANRIGYGVREGMKVAATEGLVEEPLQQMAVEHGKAFDKLCQELRKNGQATLANEAKAFWTSFAETLPKDYATFIDTAADMLPSSVGFGVTTIGNMTRRQHVHNVMTRHANRRAGSKAADTMFNLAQQGGYLSEAFDYDAGIVDYLQRAIDVRNAVEKHWRGEGGEAQKNPHRFEEAITAARQAFRNPQTGDVVREVAQAAGVDVKTAEVLTQYLQTETEAAAFSPTVRAWTSLNMSLADIDEQTIKTVLPGYVEGSFASDPDAGVYSGKVRLADGTERTIAYRVGDFSEELRAEATENAKIGSAFGDSWNARHEELGDGLKWESLSDAQRYTEALFASNAASMGSGVFELTDAKGEKVRVNADDVIRLSNGHIADIGYGPAATQATVRHETFHALWRFVRTSLDDADVQSLAKTLGVDVTNKNWERQLDEKMAHQMERYASGHYVSHAVSSRFDKMLDGFAGKAINFFAQFGQRDEVTDPQTGKPYALKDIYDKILRGELGTGALGVELAKLPAQPTGEAAATKSAMPVEVTDADRAEEEAATQAEAAKEEPPAPAAPASPAPTVTTSTVPVATAENPADASTPNQRYYRVGLPNSNVKLVGRLEVRDVETGLVTSTDADYHDRGNQNRDDRSEESRALVEKIGANPDPLQIGTVQPIASNGVVWMLPNGDVIIGNHRVNGVRLGYAKGTAENLEKFVREDAAKRGIEIGEGVKKPLLVFVLERIESPDGKADVHEVVRLANESQNRGFNIREQAGNDAKILLDNNLLPRMAFRADGRIDETKSGDAIGKFRQETGAQGMIAEDGSLTEEGQTRIQNAALAVLLGGEGTGALLQKIMSNAGRLDMQNELRALMKMTPELMALSEDKSAYDLRAPLAEALQLFTEWRDKDESARVEKGKTRHDWRETSKDGHRLRGVSWESFMSQGDMFRKPSDEAKILGDLFARAEAERSFDREDVESAVGKKRAIDLITGYLEDYIENVRAVNTETEDMFGGSPASRADVLAAQRATGGDGGGPRFSVEQTETPQFKNFFGDWQNDPENASKVVDRAGRPRVVYHGTPNGKFWTFDKNRIGETWNADETGFFFTSARHIAEDYTKPYFRENSADPNLFAVYLSIKNPLVIDKNWWQRNYGRSDIYNHDAIEIWDNEQGTILDEMRNGGHDGVIIDPNPMGGAAKMYMVPEPSQIKSATDNTGAFDPRNPDIRYSIGGIFTGTAADYANRSRQGGVDDGPSILKIGTGEGAQVYGWGLYGSTVRGVAEGYAKDAREYNAEKNGKRIDLIFPKNMLEAETAKRLMENGGDVRKTIEKLKRKGIGSAIIKELEEHGAEYSVGAKHEHLYEQTFFTDRAPGDESHLLKWYDAISDANWDRVIAQAEKEGLRDKLKGAWWLRFNGDLEHFITDNGNSGDAIYERLSKLLGSPQAASEFLARAGIDGVKYPVDSYGGKGVKDGDKVGWNYVSFRDDNIRVDHKWTDGEMRYSVSKELTDAMRKREAMQSIPVEGKVQPWPEDFPKVMLQTTLANIRQKWPELHAAAKAGSDGAALELVRNVLGEERVGKRLNPKWGKLRALAAQHPRAIIVPVIAEELTGRNKIPFVYGYMIQRITGLRLTDKIVQTVRANHTGANAVERMMRRAAFSGAVSRGAEYILVDDHVTQGGTLNELRKYIQSKGGKIVAVTTLTASQFSDTISISRDAIQGLYAKFGNNLDEKLQQAGIANGVAELTQSQARELRKLRPDTLRDRLDQARVQREREVHSRTAGLAGRSDSVSGRTDLLPGLKEYFKPDGTPTETGTRWAKARQFQRAISRELNSIIDEALLANDLTPEETAQLLDRLITSAEASDEIKNGVLPNFRSDSSTDDPSVTTIGPDGRRQFTPERKAVQQQVYDKLMADTISGENNEALETRADGTAKEDALIVAANEGRPDLPPISLQNPTYETRKDFRIDIIVGPPAAGKSSVFANALSVWYRSRVLDCDACKKGLPGFNDGNGANYVHAESSRLNKRMIYDIQHRAADDPRRGENVVLPVLGDDVEGLRKKIAEWHAVGYTVYLHNNRVPILHAFGRALLRTLATGRWINPFVIRACQDNPTRAYNEVKKEADYYDQFSNDVPLGEKPVWEDGNYLDPAYGDVRRLDGQGAERGEADGTGADGRLGRPGFVGRIASKNGQYILPGFERFSTEAPRFAYPNPLNALSDDELVSAAIAARMALGKSDKLSDRAVKINTVQKLLRRLHPDWDTSKMGLESMRVISEARKLGKKIREDLDRGVSESLILEHLPDAAREQFGREMRQEARKGQRLGVFAQRVKGEIDERQARIVEDAVRVQTGIDADNIENAYGINLSETIMHLAENPLAEKPPQTAGGAADSGEDGSASAEDGEEEATEAAAEIDAKVRAAVADIINSARIGAEADERNRQNRRAAAGRDAEREAEMAAEDADGSVPGDSFAGEDDALAAAVAKEGLNLENPRHLARFVAELARRQWIKEHGLGQNAEVWNDLVAVQFLRKTAQSVYAKLCRDLTYSRSRETAMSHISKLDAAPTVAGLMSEMEFVGALINAQRIRDTQKQKCEKLDLFLRERFGAQGRFKPDKEEGKRNVSTEAELRARYMRHAMWLTPDAAAEEARQLQETLDSLSVDFKDAGRDRDQSREFVETVRKLNVLREFGALRYKPLGEIDAAAQWWEDFERGSSDDIMREMSDRDIRTKKAAHLLAAAFADPGRKTVREGNSLSDKLNRYITGHMGFVSLLQDCMRFAPDADVSAAKDILGYIAREVQKSGDRTEAEKRRHSDAFCKAVESIYGRSFSAFMKDMMATDERFTEFMGVVGGKRVTPTRGRALQLLVSLLQEGRKVQVEDEDNPGQTRTEWIGGYHDNIVKHKREGQAQKIMRLLTPADMNMLKWLGMWYEQNRSELSDVCNSLFGIGVYAELPNYFPVKMMLEKQGLEKGEAVGWTIFPKALTPRVKNERDFDTSADIFSMWFSRMEEAAQWKHHAQLGLEMRGIFGRGELQASVIANHGASVNSLMQGFITDILAGHGAYDRSTAGVQYFSDQIRGWTALCALGGNVGVMAKQTTSIPAFGFEIGLVNTAKYMVNAFTPEGMAAMRRIWDSEQRRTRWQVGSSEAVRNALNQQGAGALKRMFQASMITNKLGDVVPALVVGQGIYRDCLARGMSEEDAMAETWSLVERTQQSGRMENQTSIQRRNKLGRIMFQFLSTQQQYLQYETRAIREVIARPDSVKRWGALGRALILNHFILSSAYFWMGQLYKACLGQEPPDDELKDWMITCLLGPYGSLMVAGFCCKATLERAIKGYSIRGGSSMLPMEQWIKTQINDGARLLEAIFDSEGDTWDEMLDAAGQWMGDVNSTVRDLRKLYRFRVKDEPQK